jgi:hypothetical protein
VGCNRLYCFYELSKESNTLEGVFSSKNFSLVNNLKLRIYTLEDGISNHIDTISLNTFSDSCFININKYDCEAYVELVSESTSFFILHASSNVVVLSRNLSNSFINSHKEINFTLKPNSADNTNYERLLENSRKIDLFLKREKAEKSLSSWVKKHD